MRAATEGGSLGFRTPQITIQYTSAVHQICQDLSMSLLTTAEIWRRKDGLSEYDVTKDVHSRMQTRLFAGPYSLAALSLLLSAIWLIPSRGRR